MNRVRAIFLALVLVLVAPITALGHHGELEGYADCESWTVQARIYSTSPDRRVVVQTTIPGTVGLDQTGFTAGKGGLRIWSAVGATNGQNIDGVVILSIYKPNGRLENQTSFSLEGRVPSNCPPPFVEPTPTPQPTPEPSIPDTSMGVSALVDPAQALGPVAGIASHYGPGGGVAMNFCTWTHRHAVGCGFARITSADTGLVVTAPIIDYCQCYTGTSDERIIDLQWDVVGALGLDLSRGLYPVTVEVIDGGQSTIPDTSMTP